jgi:CheY-like chemotaxis protein
MVWQKSEPPGAPTVTMPGNCSISEEADVSNGADLIKAVAALLWVGLAFAAVLVLRNVVRARGGSLTRLGVGPSGVTMEFAQAKLDEAVRGATEQDQHAVGQAAKRSVLDRLQRNSELLSRARILWADDHPEYNTAIVELLRRFGASVETPRSNAAALALLRASRYDMVISDVARADEGPGSNLKGLELAEQVFNGWGMRILLFTARFDPSEAP